MANNSISLLDKDYSGKEGAFRFASLLVKIEIGIIFLIFLFSNNVSKFKISDSVFIGLMIFLKLIVSFVALGGVVMLSIMTATVDTQREKESKKIAQDIVRSGNTEHLEKMEKRRQYYGSIKRDFLTSKSHKRRK